MERDQVAAIVEALALGAPVGTALDFAGCSRLEYDNWLKNSDDAASIVAEARSRSMLGPLRAIHQAYGEGVWQAAAWYLERRHADTFGRVDRLRIDGLSEYAETMAERLGLQDADLLAEAEELAAEYQVLGRVESGDMARKSPGQ